MRLFLPLCLIFSLAACATNNPEATKKAVCNELKSQIVFSGSTSNVRNAEIQNAEMPLEERNYDKNKCYQ